MISKRLRRKKLIGPKIYLKKFTDPDWIWGLRVAISTVGPLLWGLLTFRVEEAFWMAFAAQAIALVDMKGLVDHHLRMILSASFLSLSFAFLGSFVGQFPILNIIVFFFIGFLAGLFKNLGERGSALALSMYLMFIITSAYPLETWSEITSRLQWILIGASWAIIVEITNFFFVSNSTPYRRNIAEVWSKLALLSETIAAGWDGMGKRKSIRDIYLAEKEVEMAIEYVESQALEIKESMHSDQLSSNAVRRAFRAASITSINIMQLNELIKSLPEEVLNQEVKLQIFSLFRSLQQIGERMKILVQNDSLEEISILETRFKRLKRAIVLLEEGELMQASEEAMLILGQMKIAIHRTINVVRASINTHKEESSQRVYHSYSFAETMHILHPKYFKQNLQQLFSFNSFTTHYAIRVGFAASIAALLAYLFFQDHGHWLMLTTIIVAQPYFGATIKKGIQRSIGTVIGIVLGTLLLWLPFHGFFRIIMVFFSALLFIYYLKRNYAVAAIFITTLMVSLLSMSQDMNPSLLTWRIGATVLGSFIAIFSGFVLMPIQQDKEEFPKYLAKALMSHLDYFVNTFYAHQERNWNHYKIQSETNNALAFDALQRALSEPMGTRKIYSESQFQILTHFVRINRELNNINSEWDATDYKIAIKNKEAFIQLLYKCDDAFRELSIKMKKNGNYFVEDYCINTYPEEGMRVMQPTQLQMIYLQKLYTELKFVMEEV